MIMVQSTFHLQPGSKAEVMALMKNMVRLSRQEEGCLSYEYFEGITDSNQVILLQEWSDAESLQEHYQTDHMDEFLGKLGEYLESPVVTRSFVSPDEAVQAQFSAEDEPSPEQTIH
jgi:quinol monooxygenase YgiN